MSSDDHVFPTLPSASERLGPVIQRVDALVGNTPVVRLDRLGDPNGAPIFVKLEQLNPSGSIRDRYVSEILNRSIDAGQMMPGDQIALSGLDDSAVSAAFFGSLLGLGVHVFAPKSSNPRLLQMVQRYGASIVWTPEDLGIRGAISEAVTWSRDADNRFYIEAFRRQAVREAYAGISSEILDAMKGQRLGAFVSSVSTGGTFREVSRHLKDTHPTLQVAGAVLIDVAFDKLGASGNDVLQRVTMEQAWAARDMIAAKQGLLLSPKGAACVHMALQMQPNLSPGVSIVCINPDSGQRYLGWEDHALYTPHTDISSVVLSGHSPISS